MLSYLKSRGNRADSVTQSSGNNNFWVHRGKSGINGHVCTRNIELTFMSGNGHFLARVSGEVKGNVTLRKQQYRIVIIQSKVSNWQEILLQVKYIIAAGYWNER